MTVISNLYEKLIKVSRDKYGDIVTDARIIYSGSSGRARKLRLFIVNGTIIDIWYSSDREYSYHWDYNPQKGIIYRHDNSPHKSWRRLKTYPKHFHSGSEKIADCTESYLPAKPEAAMSAFLNFVKEKLISS